VWRDVREGGWFEIVKTASTLRAGRG